MWFLAKSELMCVQVMSYYRVIENKSVKEIATHLQLTEKAVEYHITKSLKFIKERLDVYYNHN